MFIEKNRKFGVKKGIGTEGWWAKLARCHLFGFDYAQADPQLKADIN